MNKTLKVTTSELCYLTPQAEAYIKYLQQQGIEDMDLAVEMTLLTLGERGTYQLEEEVD